MRHASTGATQTDTFPLDGALDEALIGSYVADLARGDPVFWCCGRS